MPQRARRYRPPGQPQKNNRDGFRGRARYEAKRRILVRDGAKCQGCGKLCTLETSQLDHIQPVATGGTHDDSNLRTLCMECHRMRHRD